MPWRRRRWRATSRQGSMPCARGRWRACPAACGWARSPTSERQPGQALGTVRDRHPDLRVEVSLANSDELIAAVKAGRIDAAVLVRPSSGGSTRLAWQDLERQPFVHAGAARRSGGAAAGAAAALRVDPLRHRAHRRPHRQRSMCGASFPRRGSSWRCARSTPSSPWSRPALACRSCLSRVRHFWRRMACARSASVAAARHARSPSCGGAPMPPTATSTRCPGR